MVHYFNLHNPSDGLQTEEEFLTVAAPTLRSRPQSARTSHPGIRTHLPKRPATARPSSAGRPTSGKGKRPPPPAPGKKHPEKPKTSPKKTTPKKKVVKKKPSHYHLHTSKCSLAAEQICRNLYTHYLSAKVPEHLLMKKEQVVITKSMLMTHSYENTQVVYREKKDANGDFKVGEKAREEIKIHSTRLPHEELLESGGGIGGKVYAILSKLLVKENYKSSMYAAIKAALQGCHEVVNGEEKPNINKEGKNVTTAWNNYTKMYEEFFKKEFNKHCGQNLLLSGSKIVDFDDTETVQKYFEDMAKIELGDLRFHMSRAELELDVFNEVVRSWRGADNTNISMLPITHPGGYKEINEIVHNAYHKALLEYDKSKKTTEIEESEIKQRAFQHAICDHYARLYVNFCNAVAKALYVLCAELHLHHYSDMFLSLFRAGALRAINEHSLECEEFAEIIRLLDNIHSIMDEHQSAQLGSSFSAWLKSDFNPNHDSSDNNVKKKKNFEVLFDTRPEIKGNRAVQNILKLGLHQKMRNHRMEEIENMLHSHTNHVTRYSQKETHDHGSLIMSMSNLLDMRKIVQGHVETHQALSQYKTVAIGVENGSSMIHFLRQYLYSVPKSKFWKYLKMQEQLAVVYQLGYLRLPFALSGLTSMLTAKDLTMDAVQTDLNGFEMDIDRLKKCVTGVNAALTEHAVQKYLTSGEKTDAEVYETGKAIKIENDFLVVQMLKDLYNACRAHTLKMLQPAAADSTPVPKKYGSLQSLLFKIVEGNVYDRSQEDSEISNGKYHASWSRRYDRLINRYPVISTTGTSTTYQGNDIAGCVDFNDARKFYQQNSYKLNNVDISYTLPLGYFCRFSELKGTGYWKKYLRHAKDQNRAIEPRVQPPRNIKPPQESELPKADCDDADTNSKRAEVAHERQSAKERRIRRKSGNGK